MSSLVGPDEDREAGKPHVPENVQEAVRTLIEWAGDDPSREGLLDTPKRVARAWKEYCQGYGEDPAVHLSRVFEAANFVSQQDFYKALSSLRPLVQFHFCKGSPVSVLPRFWVSFR